MIHSLRIHVATLDFYEDRTYLPTVVMKADRLYLLRLENEEKSEVRKSIKKIKEELKKYKIEIKERHCDIFNVLEVLQTLRKIIREESKNHIYLNITSGSTHSSTAFILASLLYQQKAHNVEIYYCGYDHTKKKANENKIEVLPMFEANLPSVEQQQLLKYLLKNNDTINTKDQVLKELDSTYKNMDPKANRDDKSKRMTTFNRQVIDKLTYGWKFLEVSGKGKGADIKLNERGRNFSRFL